MQKETLILLLPNTNFEKFILDNYKHCLTIWMDEQDMRSELSDEEDRIDINQMYHELTEIWERERKTHHRRTNPYLRRHSRDTRQEPSLP
jgi:hypothetical protein